MWVLPTRSRPGNCLRFIEAWHETQASTQVYVRLDEDDPELNELVNLPWPDKFTIAVGPRLGISRAMNELFEKFPNEPWYGFLADDLLPQTAKWDLLLVDQAGKLNISYPNDQGNNPTLPTHPVVGGELIRAIGWFGFPHTHHYFVDTVWQFIGEHLHNIYRLENVLVEHLHHSFEKSTKDQIYQEASEKSRADKQAFRTWCKSEGKVLIARLQRDIY